MCFGAAVKVYLFKNCAGIRFISLMEVVNVTKVFSNNNLAPR